ncbi:MAG: hypothetical protein ACE5JB_10980 [bacterium]
MLFSILKNKDFIKRVTVIFLLWLLNTPTALFSFTKSIDYGQYGYYLDFLTFRAGDTEKTLVEIFGQFPAQNFKFVKSVEGYCAHYELSIRLLNQDDELIQWTHQIDSVKVSSTNTISNLSQRLTRALFVVPPGQYRAELYLIDLKTHATLTFIMNIVAPDYGYSGLKVSDLQISTLINSTEEKSALVKNNWKIWPNIPRLFGMNSPTLYVYAELYNFSHRLGEHKQGFVATYTITNNRRQEVTSLDLSKEIPGETFVLVAKIPIQELKSGQYRLTLNVKGVASGKVIEKSTYFNIVNPI